MAQTKRRKRPARPHRTRNRSDTLWIYRKSGQTTPFVSPSPAVLAPGDSFLIKNFTGKKATLALGSAPITIEGDNPFTKVTKLKVNADAAPGYYEYDITVVRHVHGRRRKHRVKGGSQPGVIIDG